jgi:hypothetical protein
MTTDTNLYSLIMYEMTLTQAARSRSACADSVVVAMLETWRTT